MYTPQVMGGVYLHVRTCRCSPVFHISGATGWIVLKFGVWLEINQLCVLHHSKMACICTRARAHLFSVSRDRLDGLH